MRFDDTLETVLAADLSTPYGVQSAWRQLVDLIGRRRVPPDTRAMATLRTIRDQIPAPVRAASGRALEYANPPAPLVRLFALDDLPIALPVIRSARLGSAEWIQLLPELAPAARQILRNRRDLSPLVKRALESFGPVDFVLPDESASAVAAAQALEAAWDQTALDAADEPFEAAIQTAPQDEVAPGIEVPEPAISEVEAADVVPAAEEPLAEADPEPEPVVEAEAPEESPPVYWRASTMLAEPSMPSLPPFLTEALEVPEPTDAVPALAPDTTASEPLDIDFSFVDLAEAKLPAGPAVQVLQDVAEPQPSPEDVPAEPSSLEPLLQPNDADLGAHPSADQLGGNEDTPRLEGGDAGEAGGTFEIADVVARIDAFWRHREEAGSSPLPEPEPVTQFRFETDATGAIRWVDGVSRAPLVGLSLELHGLPGGSQVDGVAAGAFRNRAGFSNARMWVEGDSDAAGAWQISAVPVFDSANGRFTGYRGTARRPRVDERAEPARTAPSNPTADSLRQLVHELRTPTNAIAGFAEMIETQMLGPVAEPYRERAHVIRTQARELLGAIDDLDLAARIDSAALALHPARVALRPLLAGIADDLGALLDLRGAMIALPIDDLAVIGDQRAVARLLARLLATLASASGAGERIRVRTTMEADDMVAITMDRPRALADYPGDAVLGIDDEHEDATLLGTGFALRLARNLARELGGSLIIEPESLTLRLPAAVTAQVEQAHLS